ncbi:hypothetical protein J7382_08465 [Shimia sp. R11_0]|uniref:hypothetical protein n=1 Tax=Shimia sp. R11_0 TaxID=2821096 RepID=UPI001AD9B751|nr:hypothetical protein [Shimia sp. R11_0]MBO9477562.1 hypothetical protein [Shimia sp. R11_0]
MTSVSDRARQHQVPRKKRRKPRSKSGRFMVNGHVFHDRAIAGRYEQLLRMQSRGEIHRLAVRPNVAAREGGHALEKILFRYPADFSYSIRRGEHEFDDHVIEKLVGVAEFQGRTSDALRMAFEDVTGERVKLVNRNGVDLSENGRKRARDLYSRKMAATKKQVAAEDRVAQKRDW